MKQHNKALTMADVAREAGVSSMTVSRAFKSKSYVNEKTRSKILAAANRIGYVFDQTASEFSSRKTSFVAVTIPSINNANFADTVRGLTDGLSESRLQVLLGYTNYDVEEEERLIRQLLTRRPEAIICTGGVHTKDCRKLLKAAAIPVIETWDIPKDPIDHAIGFMNADASGKLVRHLYETGRRNIAFLGGDTSRDTRGLDRRRGFISEMEKLGLDASRLAQVGPPPVSMREGAQALSKLLNDRPETDAVVCVSDLAAFGALTECQRLGIDVPNELAIAGFGAYEISEICVPPITTIDPHCYEIGKKTADLILDLTHDNEDHSEETVMDVGTNLITRQSSARV